MSMPYFRYSAEPILSPKPGCPWADQMVLNPALLPDPETGRLHMLFRASGPWSHLQRPGQPLPYPIFLGYAYSDNDGETWHADFSRPALTPALRDRPEELYITTPDGRRVVNYANGCVEDPRLFYLEGQLYLTCACRIFPPGPYWEGTSLDCCTPEWARSGNHAFGRAATENVTVNVLYRVDLPALAAGRYEEAFEYVTHLTNPEHGENRDVYLFPERMVIDGRLQYVLMHRPWTPQSYGLPDAPALPSMFLATADRLTDFATDRAEHTVLAAPLFNWEADRIGGSWPPIKLGDGQWLVSYHGKGAGNFGYTQSFMIVEETDTGRPTVRHRCPDRLMFAQRPWELEGKFPTPCLFTCAGVLIGDELVMSYGAADTQAGIARTSFDSLVRYVRRFDAEGQPLSASRGLRLSAVG